MEANKETALPVNEGDQEVHSPNPYRRNFETGEKTTRDSSLFTDKPLSQHVTYIKKFYKSHISNPHNP
jgi:hypothetical protein